MKALLISNSFDKDIRNGGDMINKRNYDLLNEIFDEVDAFLIPNELSSNGMLRKVNTLLGIVAYNNFCGFKRKDEHAILEAINKNRYDVCFIGSSNIGFLCKKIRNVDPRVKIYVFFHNVEYVFYKQLARMTGWYKYILALCAKKNEKESIKYSDGIVALNIRDSKKMKELYGRQADLILPTSFHDKYKISCDYKNETIGKPMKLLFVGSDFLANYHGIKWFVKNVLDYVDASLCIVGKGTEKWKDEFANNSKINVKGSANSLTEFYEEADAVILPIFLGSGMKTKTAEALMYGKNILGTDEAFEGYDIDLENIGKRCNSSDEFISAINMMSNNDSSWYRYNEKSRQIFEKNYSNESLKKKINDFFRNGDVFD